MAPQIMKIFNQYLNKVMYKQNFTINFVKSKVSLNKSKDG